MRLARTRCHLTSTVAVASAPARIALAPLIGAAAIAIGLAPAPARADDAAIIQAFVDTGELAFIEDPVLVAAIVAQNAANDGLSQADIDALDQAWRAEVGQAETPTIDAVLHNAASEFLRARVEAGKGRFTEIFVMDAHGLNVASATVTSDYWQGDEAKFSETYPHGPGATHFGEIEKDESTGTYQVQISITLTDPETGDPIGAATFGVNAEALF